MLAGSDGLHMPPPLRGIPALTQEDPTQMLPRTHNMLPSGQAVLHGGGGGGGSHSFPSPTPQGTLAKSADTVVPGVGVPHISGVGPQHLDRCAGQCPGRSPQRRMVPQVSLPGGQDMVGLGQSGRVALDSQGPGEKWGVDQTWSLSEWLFHGGAFPSPPASSWAGSITVCLFVLSPPTSRPCPPAAPG